MRPRGLRVITLVFLAAATRVVWSARYRGYQHFMSTSCSECDVPNSEYAERCDVHPSAYTENPVRCDQYTLCRHGRVQEPCSGSKFLYLYKCSHCQATHKFADGCDNASEGENPLKFIHPEASCAWHCR